MGRFCRIYVTNSLKFGWELCYNENTLSRYQHTAHGVEIDGILL